MPLKELREVLLDTCVILHYLFGDELADNAERIVYSIVNGALKAYFSSEAYDDAITGLRSKGVGFSTIVDILEKWVSIPHETLPLTPEIAIDALNMYRKHGGPRKLHYFDSFHVATAKHYKLPLITSDKYIIQHQNELGVEAIDLRKIRECFKTWTNVC